MLYIPDVKNQIIYKLTFKNRLCSSFRKPARVALSFSYFLGYNVDTCTVLKNGKNSAMKNVCAPLRVVARLLQRLKSTFFEKKFESRVPEGDY